MSPVPYRPITWLASFPRVSGDEPRFKVAVVAFGAFSPRERG